MEKLTNAELTGEKVKITQMVAGDKGGEPNENQTALKNEVWRGPINKIDKYPNEPAWIQIDGVIPAVDGGFYVREVGLVDEDGDLIAISEYPEAYMPTLSSGAAKDFTITFVIKVSNADTVSLMVDPSVSYVTIDYVNQKMEEVKLEFYESQKAQDEVISGIKDDIGTIYVVIERIMIEMELEQKLKDGYAFYNALDGMERGMNIDNEQHVIDTPMSSGVQTITDKQAFSRGGEYVIFDESKFEVIQITKDADGNFKFNLNQSFPKGSVIARSTVRIDENNRQFVPIQKVVSQITSEVI